MALFFFNDAEEESIQKSAWRLVRSAEDRLGSGRGPEKLSWCVERLARQFRKTDRERVEDHVRAAFVNFKVEMNALKF